MSIFAVCLSRIKTDASSHLQDCGAGSRSSRGRDGQSSANYGRIPTRADSRRTLFVRRRTFWPAPEVFAADTGTIHPLVLAVLSYTDDPSTLAAWCRASKAVLPIAASRLYRTVKLKRAEDVIPHLELRVSTPRFTTS